MFPLRSLENSHRLTEGLMSGRLHSSWFYKSLFAGNESMRAARANHNISLSKKQKTNELKDVTKLCRDEDRRQKSDQLSR